MSNEDTKQEVKKSGPRGELGKGTPGKRLKAMWNEKKRPGGSLKAFVKSLKDNDDVAKWLTAKGGKNNLKRSDNNVRLSREIANATRNAKRKKKGEGAPK